MGKNLYFSLKEGWTGDLDDCGLNPLTILINFFFILLLFSDRNGFGLSRSFVSISKLSIKVSKSIVE